MNIENKIEETLSQTEPTHEAPRLKGVSKQGIIRRICAYALGLFILALGVSISVKSDLGVSPVSSIPYTYSVILGWDMGLVAALLFTFYVVLQVLILRREFELKSLLQVVVGVMFGTFVSLTNHLVVFDTPDSYILRLLLMLISIVLIALGLEFILAADIVPQPPEGLMLAIEKKTGWPFPRIKVMFDCAVVLIAGISGPIFRGELIGVREGTVLAALLVGIVLGFIRKRLEKPLDRLLLKTGPAADVVAGGREGAGE